MEYRNFFRHSLKARVTLFTLAIFVGSIWLLAVYGSRVLRAQTQEMLMRQQASMATFVAANVNDEVGKRIKALELLSKKISSK